MQLIETEQDFFKIQEKLAFIPLFQSKAWFNYQNNGKKSFVFLVDNKQDVSIALWGVVRSIPILKQKILLVNSISRKRGLSEKVVKKFFNEFLSHEFDAIEINDGTAYDIEFEIGIRRAGFFRPVNLTACPLSIVVDFERPFNFDRNWKRNIKKAIKADLQFMELKKVHETAQLISDLHLETAKTKKLNYHFDAESVFRCIKNECIRVFAVKSEQMILAVRVVYVKGNYSEDLIAANSFKSRANGATQFLMQNIFETLQSEGIKTFDFSRIPPSNHATDSVYTFKNATRGNKIQYNGEWVFYKSKIIEYFMAFYKCMILKKQRY